jgi:hypothetical protein
MCGSKDGVTLTVAQRLSQAEVAQGPCGPAPSVGLDHYLEQIEAQAPAFLKQYARPRLDARNMSGHDAEAVDGLREMPF